MACNFCIKVKQVLLEDITRYYPYDYDNRCDLDRSARCPMCGAMNRIDTDDAIDCIHIEIVEVDGEALILNRPPTRPLDLDSINIDRELELLGMTKGEH